jgi:hypothetical protein
MTDIVRRSSARARDSWTDEKLLTAKDAKKDREARKGNRSRALI